MVENYGNLRSALHLAATTQLEEARQSLMTDAEKNMKVNEQDAMRLEKAARRLSEPLLDAEVEYETVDARGEPRTEIVKIRSAVDQFSAKIAETSSELESLWES